MNGQFQTVVKFLKPIPNLTHRQHVMRLYRKSLRGLINWTESRRVFNIEATKIRAEFNANKSVDEATGLRLLREGQERLALMTHPDPYLTPYMPGGTLFMRNPAIPLEVMYPEGIPEGVSKRRVNIDFSNIPDDQEFADQVFVDSASKQYWINR